MKKQVCKLKAQINTSSSSNNNQPVILNSIHNDGMALDMKIKDIVKWKFEAHEQKAKLKEDKLLQLEMNQGRTEQTVRDIFNSMYAGTEQELSACRKLVSSL